LGRNIDFDIIYGSESFYIGTIFQWESSSRKDGHFSSGFFVNDKINKKTYLVLREGVTLILLDRELKHPKEYYYYKSTAEIFLKQVSAIEILENNLFTKSRLEFEYSRFKRLLKYKYLRDKISREQYLFGEKFLPSDFLEKFTINEIYSLFTIVFFKHKYLKSEKESNKSGIYFQNKPLWLNFPI
jgi:hypothetical protein